MADLGLVHAFLPFASTVSGLLFCAVIVARLYDRARGRSRCRGGPGTLPRQRRPRPVRSPVPQQFRRRSSVIGRTDYEDENLDYWRSPTVRIEDLLGPTDRR